jgi:RNase P subunit RPR2
MPRRITTAPSTKTSNAAKSEKVVCPGCAASLVIYRSDNPQIDECGFESYSLTCRACGSALVGIVDPLDDKLLLTVSS